MCLLCGVGALSAHAQTYVSGPVSGIWTSNGNPYIAIDTLLVLQGETLLIEPGVEVRLDEPLPFLVYGTLRAVGVESDSISFAPWEAGETWRGISFLDASSECCLVYCSLTGSRAQGFSMVNACGGAIYSEDSSPLIAHCRIADCNSDSGSLEEGGGAIFCHGGSPQILNNTIEDCFAMSFCTGGGGAICIRESDVHIRYNIIARCLAHGKGGGIEVVGSQVDIAHNVITDCNAFHYAGGISLDHGCTGTLFDNLIVGNEAPDICGGGIYARNSSVEISFCTIAFNTVGEGAWGEGGGIYASGPVAVHHCILWGNRAGSGSQIYPSSGVPVFYSDVEGGYAGDGNFDEHPLFTATTGGEMHPGYYLSAITAGQGADSPCIDAGAMLASEAGLDTLTTRTDFEPDTGVADLGYHHPLFEGSFVPEPMLQWPTRLVMSPNPFRGHTTIRLMGETIEWVDVVIYDASGRRVRHLDMAEPGASDRVVWDGRDDGDRHVPPGVYFLRTRSANGIEALSGKLILLR
jgi:hypothetical protein